jgi:creatinine amidohydrolase/Fe(II)-dependent formamide hydrolase-like protein
MIRAVTLSVCLFVFAAAPALAEVVRIQDLNTTQIRALDRAKTIVILSGGMLEEHGPYLPAFTDGILSERLTAEITQALAAKKPDWTVLLFPQIPFGASGYNEIGGHDVFPGTYAVRPGTLRAVFMDLATELGEQGFRQVFVVHVHGSPLHIHALDDAGDFFHDAYGGRMVNLWGLVPVLGGWGNALQDLPDAAKREEGVSLHAGMDEHSLMLHLRPDLVNEAYKQAPTVTGRTMADSFEVSRPTAWPGYLGSPRLASAALGEKIWRSFAAAAIDHALKVLDGADPGQFQRYADLLDRHPLYQGWMKTAAEHEEQLDAKQGRWLAEHKRR